MNVRLRMYEYCYSNLGAIYAKELCSLVRSLIKDSKIQRFRPGPDQFSL